MNTIRWRALLVLLLMSFTYTLAVAHDNESASIAIKRSIGNLPGRELVAVIVSYPPGGKSRPHRHAKSAFIYAYVLAGSIRSKIEGGQERIYRTGESFVEDPGAHHLVSENASKTKPAKLLAIFIVSPGEELTIPDPLNKEH